MSDNTQEKEDDSVKVSNKKEWVTPEKVDYDYASITEGGANLRTSDDVVGDNYRAS